MITKKSLYSKGSNQSAPTYMILGFIVTLVALLFIMQNVGLFSSETGVNSDNEKLNELAGIAEAKCNDVTGGGSSSTATGMDADFKSLTDLYIIDHHTLAAQFENKGDINIGLGDNCDYYLEDTTNSDNRVESEESFFWHFDVTATSSPPEVRIEATER